MSIQSYVPFLRQLLFKGLHRLEQIAVFFEAGERLIEFETSGLLHLSATVEIQPNFISRAELPLMVMLGFYLIVMMHIDAATVAAVAGSAS